ncbi:hypothetical protein FRC12_000162 [Ceratobasidium sp. 428]|nr:hypothetical protein FRC12_000162 [Ceratobasidium sp. 428]
MPFPDLPTSRQPELDLAEHLLGLIEFEVTTLRRHTLASRCFVDTAHRIVDELQQLLDEKTNNGDIESAVKFMTALDPLERHLLDFDRDDLIGSDKLVDVSSPLACKEDLEKWKKVRDMTHQELKSLHDEGDLEALEAFSNFRAQDLKSVCRRDDQVFLNDLVSEIKLRAIPELEDSRPYMFINASQVQDRAEMSGLRPQAFKTFFEQVPKQASKIADVFDRKSMFTSDPEALVVIQSMMAICGWSHFATKLSEDIFKDATTLKHMWSEPVCSSAEKLLDGLLEGLIYLGVDGFEVNWPKDLYQEFVDLAFGVPTLSCEHLLDLFDDVGPAYRAQAAVLIALCRKAAEYSNAAQPEDSQRVENIGQALDLTSKVLTKATQTANNGAGVSGLPHWILHKEGQEYDQDECSVQFQTAMTTVVETLTKIGLGAAAIKGKTDFEAAVKEDKNRAKQANERIAAVKAPEDAFKVTVNGISSITAVKRELTGKSARFELNGTPIAKDQNIGELVGSEQALTLDMVISGNPVGPMDEVTAEAAPTGEAAGVGLARAKVSQVTKARQRRAAFDIALEERGAFLAKEVQRITEFIAASSASDAPDSGINPDAPKVSRGSGELSSAQKSPRPPGHPPWPGVCSGTIFPGSHRE